MANFSREVVVDDFLCRKYSSLNNINGTSINLNRLDSFLNKLDSMSSIIRYNLTKEYINIYSRLEYKQHANNVFKRDVKREIHRTTGINTDHYRYILSSDLFKNIGMSWSRSHFIHDVPVDVPKIIKTRVLSKPNKMKRKRKTRK